MTVKSQKCWDPLPELDQDRHLTTLLALRGVHILHLTGTPTVKQPQGKPGQKQKLLRHVCQRHQPDPQPSLSERLFLSAVPWPAY